MPDDYGTTKVIHAFDAADLERLILHLRYGHGGRDRLDDMAWLRKITAELQATADAASKKER